MLLLKDERGKLHLQFSHFLPLVPWAAPRWVSYWWFWSCTVLGSVSPSAGGGECAAMTTCGDAASHPPPRCLWSSTSTCEMYTHVQVCLNFIWHKVIEWHFKIKVFSNHIRAFLWTWTTGLYFLYGRFRDIISTEPSSSRMLMYWKERKSENYSLARSTDRTYLHWTHFITILSLSFCQKTSIKLHTHAYTPYTHTYLGSVEFNSHLTEIDH